MSQFACTRCGAPVSLPAEPYAMDAPCTFCGARSPLPAEMLRVRLEEQQLMASRQQQAMAAQRQAEMAAQVGANVRRTTSMVMWIVLVSVAVPLIITAVVLFSVLSTVTQAVPHHR